jgi:hypothetical protein
MAQALGVNDRTVRRWVSRAAEPQPGIWQTLLQIVRRRQRELDDLVKAIELEAKQ